MALFWGHLPSHGRTSLVCISAHVGPGSESGLIAQAQIFMAAELTCIRSASRRIGAALSVPCARGPYSTSRNSPTSRTRSAGSSSASMVVDGRLRSAGRVDVADRLGASRVIGCEDVVVASQGADGPGTGTGRPGPGRSEDGSLCGPFRKPFTPLQSRAGRTLAHVSPGICRFACSRLVPWRAGPSFETTLRRQVAEVIKPGLGYTEEL